MHCTSPPHFRAFGGAHIASPFRRVFSHAQNWPEAAASFEQKNKEAGKKPSLWRRSPKGLVSAPGVDLERGGSPGQGALELLLDGGGGLRAAPQLKLALVVAEALDAGQQLGGALLGGDLQLAQDHVQVAELVELQRLVLPVSLGDAGLLLVADPQPAVHPLLQKGRLGPCPGEHHHRKPGQHGLARTEVQADVPIQAATQRTGLEADGILDVDPKTAAAEFNEPGGTQEMHDAEAVVGTGAAELLGERRVQASHARLDPRQVVGPEAAELAPEEVPDVVRAALLLGQSLPPGTQERPVLQGLLVEAKVDAVARAHVVAPRRIQGWRQPERQALRVCLKIHFLQHRAPLHHARGPQAPEASQVPPGRWPVLACQGGALAPCC